MGNYTLQLTDGLTTIDFYSGETTPTSKPGYFVQEGGLDLPAPPINTSFNQTNQADGAPMSRAVYGNRTITITFGIIGSSLADLKTKIRTLQGCLNDAAYRYLQGGGSTLTGGNLFYLALQWGTTAGQSTNFDVLRGDLQLPADWLSSTKLTSSFSILDCKLILTCLPFGRYANQTISMGTFSNCLGNSVVSPNVPNAISPYYNESGSAVLASTAYYIQSATYRIAQPFTPTGNLTATGGAFYTYGTMHGNIYVEIYATSGGLPTGAALATGNVSAATTASLYDDPHNWIFVPFATPVALTSGVTYALVMRCPGWQAGDSLRSLVYTGGGGVASYYASDGITWTNNSASPWAYVVTQQASPAYKQITTDTTYGDVPAGTEIFLGTLPTFRNIWIAKRSGNSIISPASVPRYQEPIFIPGGNVATYGIDNGESQFWSVSPVPTGTIQSPVMGGSGRYKSSGTSAHAVGHLSYALSGISAGTFRVLMRARVTDITYQGFAIGWQSVISSLVSSVPTAVAAIPAVSGTFQVFDMGQLIVPSVAYPGSDTLLKMPEYLNIYCWQILTAVGGLYLYYDIDWIFLLPTDEGYVNFQSGTAYACIDALSKATGIYDTDAAWAYIANVYASVGPLPQIGRESTTFYIIVDAPPTQSLTGQIVYQPRFLTI